MVRPSACFPGGWPDPRRFARSSCHNRGVVVACTVRVSEGRAVRVLVASGVGVEASVPVPFSPFGAPFWQADLPQALQELQSTNTSQWDLAADRRVCAINCCSLLFVACSRACCLSPAGVAAVWWC